MLVYRINSACSGDAQGPPDELYIYRPGGTQTVNGTLSSAPFTSDLGRTVLDDETNPSTFLTSGSPGGLTISNVGARGDSLSFVLGTPATAVVDSFAAVYGRSDSIVISWSARAQYRCRGFELEMSDSTPAGYVVVGGSFQPGGGTTGASVRYSHVDRLNPGKKYYRIKEIDSSFAVRYSAKVATVIFPTAVAGERKPSSRRFALMQNYPNPFNPATVLQYELPAAADVRLVVFDLLGREVAVLAEGRKAAGTYAVHFNGGGLASGVYVYRLVAGGYTESRKFVVMR